MRLSLPISEGADATARGGSRNRGLTADELLAALANHPEGMTPKNIQELTGVSERVAQKRLKALYDDGKLSREKDARSWRYRVGSLR